MNERKTMRNKWKWVSQQLLVSVCIVLTNNRSLTDLSLVENKKMKYWIAMSTIIIFTISV